MRCNVSASVQETRCHEPLHRVIKAPQFASIQDDQTKNQASPTFTIPSYPIIVDMRQLSATGAIPFMARKQAADYADNRSLILAISGGIPTIIICSEK